ncbi:MAG TPA: hypothetical protein PLV68_21470, partial [Ilumatobacteraceae bacterium]|nr:hypothetical protein [Ilumatobacteraceae bacterium]
MPEHFPDHPAGRDPGDDVTRHLVAASGDLPDTNAALAVFRRRLAVARRRRRGGAIVACGAVLVAATMVVASWRGETSDNFVTDATGAVDDTAAVADSGPDDATTSQPTSTTAVP